MPRSLSIIALFVLGLALGALPGFGGSGPTLDLDRGPRDDARSPIPTAVALEFGAARRSLPQKPPVVDAGPTPQEETKPREFMPRVDWTATVRLHGTLTGVWGHPAASRSFRWRVRFGPQVLTGYLQTDDGGRFTITLNGGLHAGVVGELMIEPGKPVYGLQVTRPSIERARVKLPEPVPQGDVELGTLPLGLLPLVCSGRVVDAEGRPVARATVTADVLSPGNPSPHRHHLDLKSDGSFELRLPWRPAGVTLKAECDGMLSAGVTDVVFGSKGIEIRLEPAASLSGRLPEGETATDYVLIDSAGGRHEAPTRWVRLGGRTRFEFREIRPGPARLRIENDGRALVDLQLTLTPGANTIP